MSYLRWWDGRFECEFSIGTWKIHLMWCCHIGSHFVVFNLFLRRPQILLTIIKPLPLTKSNLRKKKRKERLLFQIKFNSILLVHIAN